MKQLIELNIEQAISLANFFLEKGITKQHEKSFFKISETIEFYELIDRKEDFTDNIRRAKFGVRMIFSTASGFSMNEILPEKTLKIDLEISPNIFSRLHRPFNRLVRNLGSNKLIKSSEVAKCNTVKDCQDLVIKKL